MALPDKVARAFDSIGYGKRGENLYNNVPAMQRQIEDAADDPAALFQLLSDNIGLSDARPAVSSYDMPAPAGRDPMSFENRATRDPNINEAVSDLGMGADTPLPFKLDAYADSVAADGIENLIERMRFSAPQPEYSMDIANNRDILNQDITDLFPPTASGVSDVMPGAAPGPRPNIGPLAGFGPGAERRALASVRDNYPAPYDSLPDDIMDPANLADFPPSQQRLLGELADNDFLGFDYPSQALNETLQPGFMANSDLSPGLVDARNALVSSFDRPSPGGGLITQGGPGVPIGGPTGSGVTVPSPTGLSTQVTPRTGLPGFGPRRLGTTAGVPQGAVDPRRATAADATTRPTPRLESPDVVGERRAMNNLEDAVEAARGQDRAARAEAARPGAAAERARQWASDNVRGAAQAAGIAALGAAAQLGMQRLVGPGGQGGQALVPNITRPPRAFSTADLAAETSPPPQIMTQEPDPISPREQGHALQRRLNEMRSANGGREVPEAQAMRREIQRLFDISDAQANAAARAGKVDPAPTNNPLQQARSIMAAMNAGAVPANQRARMQAEMQRLYRLADEQANARTAAPRRAG